MDPLILIIEEIDRMRHDLTQLENELSDCEVRIDFRKDDPRYIRLSTEKDLVLRNLCDIRKELCAKGKRCHIASFLHLGPHLKFDLSYSDKPTRKCDLRQERRRYGGRVVVCVVLTFSDGCSYTQKGMYAITSRQLQLLRPAADSL
jgi:hypothetical protein